MKLLCILSLVLLTKGIEGFTWPVLVINHPTECSSNETYNIVDFQCLKCGEGQRPKSDGYGCECLDDHVVVHDTGFYGYPSNANDESGKLKCKKCPKGYTTTREKDACIKCVNDNQCLCGPKQILIDRSLDGTPLEQIECRSCQSGFQPSPDGRNCMPCRYPPILEDNPAVDCNCSIVAGGVCLPANLGMEGLYAPSQSDEIVKFGEEDIEVHSAFFKEHVKVAAYMCYEHKNASACQMLGNLCALAMHSREQKSCDLLYSLTKRTNFRHAPQLYFSDRTSSIILREEEINNVYNTRGGNDRLNITAARYSLRGDLLSLDVLSGPVLQMCNGSYLELDGAFDFGTKYEKKCQIPVHQLFSKDEPEFYDLFIEYKVNTGRGSEKRLFAIPILLRNFPNNENNDGGRWLFTNRIFLVDPITAIPVASSSGTGNGNGPNFNEGGDPSGHKLPLFVRYLSRIDIQVSMINTRESPEKAGRLYPPLVEVEYGVVSQDDLKKGEKVDFSFTVSYEMEMKESKKDIEIAVGVLSVFAVLWSAMEAWSWARRSGKLAVDPMVMTKFVALSAGNLANVFLVVMYFTSLYWFIFFKEQTFLHVILPTSDQENEIKRYIISIFALKVVDIIHLILSQISVDLFLVDWERPHAVVTSTKSAESTANATKEMAVSVWRTYLVANEWNELQTRRKTHLAVQIVLVVFILKVCGIENISTADPHSNFNLDDGLYHSPYSFVCRFALGASIYIFVALLQVIFWCGIYNGCVESKLHQFVDVCSLANISVFVMAENNFGYYIHGKSAHGFSDTNMATLIEQLQREADDFCGHRGLLAGSDEQTFIMSLPAKLRSYYDNIVTPVASEIQRLGPQVHTLSGGAIQHMVDAYSKMNKFLTRFLEHALRDLDYEVRNRMFLEKVLDIEFNDANVTDKAVFYSDSSNAFDAVLLYGHEFSLTMFDMMVFLFIDLFAQDFLLAGIITFFIGELVKVVRYIGGKSNLARKTLIDRRFLI